MEGQKFLNKCTVRVAFSKDVDPIVDRLNMPWTVKCDPEEVVKTATVKYGDNGIQIILELNTVELLACDGSGGDPQLYTLVGCVQGATE